jgi:hypothetical protein
MAANRNQRIAISDQDGHVDRANIEKAHFSVRF